MLIITRTHHTHLKISEKKKTEGTYDQFAICYVINVKNLCLCSVYFQKVNKKDTVN